MNNKKDDVLTTGQVANICKVAPRTVTKWFDSGKLKGYRIPGSRDRRIPANELIRFMKVNNMPMDDLEIGVIRVLLIDSDWHWMHTLSDNLSSRHSYQVTTADNEFDVGFVAHKFRPHCVIINLMADKINAANICRHLHSTDDLQPVKVLAVAERLNENEHNALLQKGFDEVVTEPGNINSIISAIDHATAILY